jgi:SAM-dependent methyltransferase
MDTTAIKQKQQATWASGDYSAVGTRLLIMAEELAEAVELHAGERVLDVATGNGNAALAAARRFAVATGVDYVPSLIERAKKRAEAEDLEVDFRVGDAEALPFEDESFDVVLSTIGVMFAPDQEQSAAELLRVLRPGGRIGLASWTPQSWVGQLFKIIGGYVAPPPGLRPPVQWGDEARLRELLGPDVKITAQRRTLLWRFPDSDYIADFFIAKYGPTLKAHAAQDPEKGAALRADIAALSEKLNVSGDDTLVLPMEYLEVVATKPS